MQAKTGQTNRNVTNNRAINLIELHMKGKILKFFGWKHPSERLQINMMDFWLGVRNTKIRFSDDCLSLEISSWPGPFRRWKAFAKSKQQKERNAKNVIALYYYIIVLWIMIYFYSSLELSIHSDISSAPHMLFFNRVTDSRSCSGLEVKHYYCGNAVLMLRRACSEDDEEMCSTRTLMFQCIGGE